MIHPKALFSGRFLAPLVLLLCAIALRGLTFGNPMLEPDEQFYLFAGGRLLEGDLPYVDVWDRKPLGIFLLYAFFHLFGSGRILAYQVGALGCLWGTALLVRGMAARIAPPAGAFMAALLYEIWPNLAGGEGGQSPIFYSLPVAAAMGLVVHRLSRFQANAIPWRNTGVVVMLLFGLAMQIKYTSIFEGIFAGLALLWLNWQQRKNIRETSINALLWTSCAIAPTFAVFLFYALEGYGAQWWFANVVSILKRGAPTQAETLHLALKLTISTLPLAVLWPARKVFNISFTPAQRPIVWFLNGWTLSALVGVMLFGTWFPHYALPLFVPLAIQAAPLWYTHLGRASLILMACIGTCAGQITLWKHHKNKGNRQVFSKLEQAIAQNGGGCTFVFNGPMMLYDTKSYCKLSRYQFPSLFYFESEAHATGMDPASELTRILAQHPQHIVTQEPVTGNENPAVRSVLSKALQENYQKTFMWQRRASAIIVYTLKTTPAPTKTP